MSRWLTLVLGAVAVLAAIYGLRAMMTSGSSIETVRAETVPTLDKPVADGRVTRDGMQVVVVRSTSERRPLYVSLTGRTESVRTVTARAETTGTVRAAPAEEGRMVKSGDVLCELDVEGRGARVREAEAEFRAKELEHNAAAELVSKGWATAPRLESAKASLDAARASLSVARSELAKTRVTAPFGGVFEKRLADIGDFLAPGSACGVVVQLDPILVVAEAGDQNAARIQVDSPARLRLSDGQEAQGQVRYLAKTADPTARTFRVEVELANPEGEIPVGRVTEVRIQVGEGEAHRVDANYLTLDEQGRIGLRYLDVGGVVGFMPADVVDESPQGIWVAGLPKETLIVAPGQEAVRAGVRATPVFQETIAP